MITFKYYCFILLIFAPTLESHLHSGYYFIYGTKGGSTVNKTCCAVFRHQRGILSPSKLIELSEHLQIKTHELQSQFRVYTTLGEILTSEGLLTQLTCNQTPNSKQTAQALGRVWSKFSGTKTIYLSLNHTCSFKLKFPVHQSVNDVKSFPGYCKIATEIGEEPESMSPSTAITSFSELRQSPQYHREHSLRQQCASEIYRFKQW